MQRQTYPTSDSKLNELGGRIETQIQGLQVKSSESLCSLVQRIADLELENSRLKRTIKNTKTGPNEADDRFSKLGGVINIYGDITETPQRSIGSTPFVVSLIDGSKVAVSHVFCRSLTVIDIASCVSKTSEMAKKAANWQQIVFTTILRSI